MLSPAVRRSLKVSIVAPCLSGGGMTRAYFLAGLVRELGHEAAIAGVLAPGRAVYPPPAAGVRVEPIPMAGPRGLAREMLRRLDGEVLYALKPRGRSFGLALLARLARRRPLLLDIDDCERSLNDARARARGRRRALGWLLERLVPLADGVTASSSLLAARYGGAHLPSGKDIALFDPALHDPEESRRRHGLAGLRVLLFPGTPRPHKGLEDVLLALDELAWPDARLVLAGGRRDGDGYASELAARWPRWVVRLARRPLEEMPSVVAAAHVFVVPQRDTATARAQLPMKLTDGMAMAKPILATRVGDIPSVLGDAGLLVPPSSPAALAERLRWVFSHPEAARRLGERARERCVESYSLEPLSATLAGVLDGVLRARRAGAGALAPTAARPLRSR